MFGGKYLRTSNYKDYAYVLDFTLDRDFSFGHVVFIIIKYITVNVLVYLAFKSIVRINIHCFKTHYGLKTFLYIFKQQNANLI